MTRFANITHATQAQMTAAFQLHRRQILRDCLQLKTDLDSYNENGPGTEPITINFDFTQDLAKNEAATCDPQ